MLGQIVPATCETYSNNQQQNSYAHAITAFKKNTSGHNNQQDNENWLHEVSKLFASTSPSSEKLRAEIAVAIDSSESPPSKLGSPGGPLASKTFITVILQ